MKLEHGIIISVGVLVCVSLGLIANNPSEIVSYSSLEKINQDAKESENQDLIDKNRLKMKKHLEVITSSALGINIDSIYLKDDWNFPFRDSSEVKHTREEYKNNPICNILPNLSLHLQSIRETELFQMYGKKYQNHFIELDIADERYYNSTVHYGFTTKSGNNYASTHFHVDSCTGQTSDYLYLRCHNPILGNGTGSNYRSEVIASLQNNEFCKIVLEPWREKLAKYNEKISNDVDGYLIKIKQQDSNNPEEMIPITKDLHRLNQLGDMVRLAMDGNHNDAEFSEKMKKYELQYGSVPEEFSELLGEIENEN